MKLLLITILAGLNLLSSSTNAYSATRQDGRDARPGIGNGIVDGNFIGGFNNFDPASFTVYKSGISTPTVTVHTVASLKQAIRSARPGDKIYLDDNSTFDLSGEAPLLIPASVTLFSGRGLNKGKGALVFSNTLKTIPMLYVNGNNARISGIRIKGPDGLAVNTKELQKAKLEVRKKSPAKIIDEDQFTVYGIPNSRGIQINGKNVVVDNCEIWNWSHAGIYMLPSSTADIHHNYIHHNQRYGLGYGICLDGSNADITANIFDYNRHAIAGTGAVGTSYNATYNIALPHSTLQSHIFDMHGSAMRKDGAKLAGDRVEISNNLFFVTSGPAIRIRGVPQQQSNIRNNEYILVRDKERAFRQYQAGQISKDTKVKQESQVEQYSKKTLGIFNNSVFRTN
ncbi:right-handed parallel beta-helix repeat-containing protein [Chitinophaga sp. NPDC101104]|uniref:right-handed parallel beta-helix repeat-containing protein n=1 Tax=Chitinophaga sp. NPDC101104 TaxID=3390561 RepID=UPI003D094CD5